MTKDNILFGTIGLLAGLIIGFMFANSVNQNAPKPGAQTANTAIGNSGVSQNAASAQSGPAVAQVKEILDKADAEPDNFDAQVKAAESHYKIRSFDKAIEYLLKANKLKPDDYETAVNLGNAYFDSNKYEEAEKYYSQALAKQPHDNSIRTDLGLTFIFRSNPDYDRAIKEFLQVLETEPNHKQALQNITVAYLKKGDAAKAKEYLAKLESADPANQSIAKLREEIQKLPAK